MLKMVLVVAMDLFAVTTGCNIAEVAQYSECEWLTVRDVL